MAKSAPKIRGDGTTPIIPEVAPNGRPPLGRQVALDHARVAELADAPGLGPGVRKDLGVRVPPLAPLLTCGLLQTPQRDNSESASCSRLLTELPQALPPEIETDARSGSVGLTPSVRHVAFRLSPAIHGMVCREVGPRPQRNQPIPGAPHIPPA